MSVYAYIEESQMQETPNFVQVNYNKIESEANFDEVLLLNNLNCHYVLIIALKRANILTLADLANESFRSLMQLRNFGQKSADEVRGALSTYGIELKED